MKAPVVDKKPFKRGGCDSVPGRRRQSPSEIDFSFVCRLLLLFSCLLVCVNARRYVPRRLNVRLSLQRLDTNFEADAML